MSAPRSPSPPRPAKPTKAPRPTVAGQAAGGSPALHTQLQHCAKAVEAVRAGRSLTQALSQTPAALRPGVQAQSYCVMRHLGQALHVRQALCPRTPSPAVDALLLSALSLAIAGMYPSHTLVDQAVECCKRNHRAASGLLNAVLRRYLREHDSPALQLSASAAVQANHPHWWVKQLQADWPQHWPALLEVNQKAPPMSLRVNQRRAEPQAYLKRLQEAGLGAQRLLGQAFHGAAWWPGLGAWHPIVLTQAVAVTQLPDFGEGAVSVQDASAQLAAPLLLGQACTPAAQGANHLRVLDACAAPGGKTAHLLELADVSVTALEIDAERTERIHDTLDRLHLQAQVRQADACEVSAWWDGQAYDAILLDAPCSASGIVRRHPDVRWLRRQEDLTELAKRQDALLDALWPLLKPGGRLLYCTCSVFRIEGQDRIDAFLQRTPDALVLPAPGHILPVLEYDEALDEDPGDGFFYALLSKAPLDARDARP